MVHAAISPEPRQDDAPSNVVPFPGSNHAINDETKAVYDDGFIAEPEQEPVTAPVDPTGDILSAHGPSVLAAYHLIRFETEQNGGCRLGYEGIGARMRCTERTAMRHVKTLIDGGFVESRKRTRVDGATLPNELAPTRTYGVTCKTPQGDIGGDMHVGVGVTSGVTFPPIPPSVLTNDKDSHPLPPQNDERPLPRNGVAQQIVAAYCEHVRIKAPTNYRKSVGQANQLAKAGIAPDDVPALHARACRWAGSADLGTMLATVERYLQEKSSPPAVMAAKPLPPELLRDIEADTRSYTDMRRQVPEARKQEHQRWIESYHQTGRW